MVLVRFACLLVSQYLIAALAVARWTILPEHRAILGAVAALCLFVAIFLPSRGDK